MNMEDQKFYNSAAAFLLWAPYQVRGKYLPPLGSEINTADFQTAGISCFKKIVLTQGLVGGSCTLDALPKHLYI